MIVVRFAAMSDRTLTIALISDVFYDDDGPARLLARLQEAHGLGAQLAVLPELPLNPWSPATKSAREDDAEPPEGPRATVQRDAARQAGLGLVGGVILRDPATGARRNTALIIDAAGELLGTFQKLHVPEEPGFWETSHYEPGTSVSPVFNAFGLPFGVQICSDINRPEGCHLLGAMGAAAVLAPRATERATWDRWRTVLRANALTSALYVLTVNRPAPEQDVLIGGPSFAAAPDGRILLETTDPVAVVTIGLTMIDQARQAYPGYLPVRAELYAAAWRRVADGSAIPTTHAATLV